MAAGASRGAPQGDAGRAPARLPRWLIALALLVLLAVPAAGGVLLLTSDGWAVNRANVAVWQATVVPLGLGGAVSPEDFAVLANVLLFVPVFAALAVLVPSWWWVLAAAAVSGAVELHQLSLGTREASIGDVLANTAGAALGVLLGRAVRRAVLARPRLKASGPTAAGPEADDAASPAAAGQPGTTGPGSPDGAPVGSDHGPASAPDGRG